MRRMHLVSGITSCSQTLYLHKFEQILVYLRSCILNVAASMVRSLAVEEPATPEEDVAGRGSSISTDQKHCPPVNCSG